MDTCSEIEPKASAHISPPLCVCNEFDSHISFLVYPFPPTLFRTAVEHKVKPQGGSFWNIVERAF